jgi:hypothetical protein
LTNHWLLDVLAVGQGVLFWPVFERTFMAIHSWSEQAAFARSVLASLSACLAAGVLLIVPIAVIRALSGKGALGDFREHSLLLLAGMVAYRISSFLGPMGEQGSE